MRDSYRLARTVPWNVIIIAVHGSVFTCHGCVYSCSCFCYNVSFLGTCNDLYLILHKALSTRSRDATSQRSFHHWFPYSFDFSSAVTVDRYQWWINSKAAANLVWTMFLSMIVMRYSMQAVTWQQYMSSSMLFSLSKRFVRLILTPNILGETSEKQEECLNNLVHSVIEYAWKWEAPCWDMYKGTLVETKWWNFRYPAAFAHFRLLDVSRTDKPGKAIQRAAGLLPLPFTNVRL